MTWLYYFRNNLADKLFSYRLKKRDFITHNYIQKYRYWKRRTMRHLLLRFNLQILPEKCLDICWEKVSRIFPVFFFPVLFQFASAPYWESNFPNCLWHPLFIETSPSLFKSNLWTVGGNKLTVIDLCSSARAFQPEKSTEIACSFEDYQIWFSRNLIKPQVLSLLSLKSSLFRFQWPSLLVSPEFHTE